MLAVTRAEQSGLYPYESSEPLLDLVAQNYALADWPYAFLRARDIANMFSRQRDGGVGWRERIAMPEFQLDPLQPEADRRETTALIETILLSRLEVEPAENADVPKQQTWEAHATECAAFFDELGG